MKKTEKEPSGAKKLLSKYRYLTTHLSRGSLVSFQMPKIENFPAKSSVKLSETSSERPRQDSDVSQSCVETVA